MPESAMSAVIKPHNIKLLCLYACPKCRRDSHILADSQRRKAQCANCGTVFPVAPLGNGLLAQLQAICAQSVAAIKAQPDPPSTTAICFDIAAPLTAFTFDRLVQLDELHEYYGKNADEADKLFKGRHFCFLGTLDELGIFESFVSASMVSPKGGFTVFCDFSGKNDHLAKSAEGDLLLVQGTCRGLLNKNNPDGCVFNGCTLLASKGRRVASERECANKVHEIPPKSPTNPYDIHILLKNEAAGAGS